MPLQYGPYNADHFWRCSRLHWDLTFLVRPVPPPLLAQIGIHPRNSALLFWFARFDCTQLSQALSILG